VVTEQLVLDVFGLESRVLPDPVSGTPLIIPIGRHHTPSAAPSTAEAGTAEGATAPKAVTPTLEMAS
jgi:hypothetical protein